jgi:hypothetical protein
MKNLKGRVKFVRFRFKDGITNGVEWYVVSGGKSISFYKKKIINPREKVKLIID